MNWLLGIGLILLVGICGIFLICCLLELIFRDWYW